MAKRTQTAGAPVADAAGELSIERRARRAFGAQGRTLPARLNAAELAAFAELVSPCGEFAGDLRERFGELYGAFRARVQSEDAKAPGAGDGPGR